MVERLSYNEEAHGVILYPLSNIFAIQYTLRKMLEFHIKDLLTLRTIELHRGLKGQEMG